MAEIFSDFSPFKFKLFAAEFKCVRSTLFVFDNVENNRALTIQELGSLVVGRAGFFKHLLYL